MEQTLDRLEAILRSPTASFGEIVSPVALWLLTQFGAGLAIGLGVAAGIAIAG
jgi:hypothetical protein